MNLLNKLLRRFYLHAALPLFADEEGAAGETPPEDGETVGTGNDARLKLLNDIADRTEGERAEELAGVNDDSTVEPFQQETAPASDETPPPQEETPPAEPEVKKYRLKVNGKELELTAEELIARAQKVESADDYLRQASEKLRTTEPPATPPKPKVPDEEALRRQDEEDKALVRAIQMGSEEEATAAIRKLREQASARPSFSQDDVYRTIDERLNFNTAIRQFEKDFADIAGDDRLYDLARKRDEELLAAGDKRSYADRYTEIGNEIRAWIGKVAPKPKEDPSVLEDKQAKKAAAPKPVQAASKKVTPPPAEDDEVDDNPAAVIAQMAKTRGGPQWMRN